jgi:HEAT repeat protein
MSPRRAAGSSFIIAAGVLLAFGLQSREALLQEWRLFRLHSRDVEARRASARHLGRPGSTRAARGLIALLAREADGGVRDEAALALGEIGPAIGPPGVAALLREIDARAGELLA